MHLKSDEQISMIFFQQNNYYINCNFFKFTIDLISSKLDNNPVNYTLTNSHKIITYPIFWNYCLIYTIFARLNKNISWQL